jgi:Putative DNA-binding domain
MIQKPIDQITSADIQSLVAAREGEHRQRDYKLQLPGGRDDEKKEFLYDVASFANAAGGDLIFGIADERDESGKSTGRAASADGIAVGNLSETVNRLENLVRDGIKPRIPNIEWQPVEGFANGMVLVMRIPKSLVAPHMVTFAGVSRFYSRNSTGKYPLDVGEIRSAFAASTSIGEKLRTFRLDRLARISSEEIPVAVGDDAKMILHMVPLSALEASDRDVTKSAAKLQIELQPMGEISGWGNRYNFDGVLVYATIQKSYVQVFRSGTIEATDGETLQPAFAEYKNLIPSTAVEQYLILAVRRYLSAQNKLQLTPPIFVAITLMGVKNFAMATRF